MPTAAKLFCALFLAATAVTVAVMVAANLPPSQPLGWFIPITGLLGAVMGWRIVGNRAGQGYGVGISNGLTATVSLVVSTLALFAIVEMVDRSYNRRYDNVIEAIGGAISIAGDYAQTLPYPDILGALVLGAVFVGILGEFVSGRWR